MLATTLFHFLLFSITSSLRSHLCDWPSLVIFGLMYLCSLHRHMLTILCRWPCVFAVRQFLCHRANYHHHYHFVWDEVQLCVGYWFGCIRRERDRLGNWHVLCHVFRFRLWWRILNYYSVLQCDKNVCFMIQYKQHKHDATHFIRDECIAMIMQWLWFCGWEWMIDTTICHCHIVITISTYNYHEWASGWRITCQFG